MRTKTKDLKTKVEDVDEKGVVTIYVSSFNNKDSDGDIITPGAFKKTISEGSKRIRHLKNHSWNMLLGLPKEMEEDGNGLRVVSAMNMAKQLVKDTYEDYKFFAENERTLEHSIGYRTIKEYYDNDRDANILSELMLMEYSTLDFWGANENTPMVDLKNFKSYEDLLNTLTDMLKGDYSDERFAKIEQSIKQLKTLIEQEPDTSTQNDDKPLIDSFINAYKN